MAVVSAPPKRRFTMTIEVDADNTARMSEVLSNIDYELWQRPDTERNMISGGGWHLRIVEHPDGLTGDEYEAALSAWWQETRTTRRAKATSGDS